MLSERCVCGHHVLFHHPFPKDGHRRWSVQLALVTVSINFICYRSCSESKVDLASLNFNYQNQIYIVGLLLVLEFDCQIALLMYQY